MIAHVNFMPDYFQKFTLTLTLILCVGERNLGYINRNHLASRLEISLSLLFGIP